MGDKKHQQKEWLEAEIQSGKTSKQIADENNLSYKLVEMYLRQHGIPFTPKTVLAENKN
jgi:hypothetical protein